MRGNITRYRGQDSGAAQNLQGHGAVWGNNKLYDNDE